MDELRGVAGESVCLGIGLCLVDMLDKLVGDREDFLVSGDVVPLILNGFS